MRVAIYPGSFNPWHKGHDDILDKALEVFDMVVVAQGINPLKSEPKVIQTNYHGNRVTVEKYNGLLKDYIDANPQLKICAIVKGLRNTQDLEYEKVQQYYNEDLGIKLPVVYFISDRGLTHISSSAERALEGFKK